MRDGGAVMASFAPALQIYLHRETQIQTYERKIYSFIKKKIGGARSGV